MSLPYFPLYPTDFEADTSHLTLAEDGAYNRLMRLCWMTPGCSLPDDDAWIYRRMRAHCDADKEAISNVLSEFFDRENGRVFSSFMSASLERRRKSTPRPAIPLDVIQRVTSHYGEVCFYCGCEEGPFEIDHVFPWSRGGGHTFENLVVSCRPCNRSKGSKTIEEWGGRYE